ncbi:MAG: TolC family protein [Bacteroides sp.]|nr:TolC family protein [Bacteroides sp.]
MKKKLIAIIAFCAPMWAQAQSIEQVLQSIEQNNKELQSQAQLSKAQKMENRTENNLPDPTVSYSSFYKNGAGTGHGTELVATQGFDFPTQYITRNRQATLENQAVDLQQQAARRDILLQAKLLCLELILLNQENELIQIRQKNADDLQAMYEKRLQTGDANALEVNKVKMERMNVQAEVAQNNAAHRTALQSLLAMNGNLPLEFSANTYPQVKEINDYNTLRDEVIASDLDLQALGYAARAAEKQVSVDKQNWLPKLEAGFRRNTESEMSMNGFVIGGSIPLFSNRKKVQIAKAQALSAQLQQEDAQLEKENELMSLYNEMQQLKEALATYDVPLMHRSLALLKQALEEGQLSLIEYFVEAEGIYRNLQARMQLENQYQKVMANIYKNEL